MNCLMNKAKRMERRTFVIFMLRINIFCAVFGLKCETVSGWRPLNTYPIGWYVLVCCNRKISSKFTVMNWNGYSFSSGKLFCGKICGCTDLNDSYWITWFFSVDFVSLRGHCEWILVFDALHFAANDFVSHTQFHSSRCWFTSLNRQLKFIKLNSGCIEIQRV